MAKRNPKSKQRAADVPAKMRLSLWLLAALVLVVAVVAILMRQTRIAQQGRDSTSTSQSQAPVNQAPIETEKEKAPRNGDSMAEAPESHVVTGGKPSVNSDPLTAVTTKAGQIRQAAEQRVLDPRQDGWPTEVFAEHAKKSLSDLVQFATNHGKGEAPRITLGSIAAEDIRSTELRPDDLVTVYQDAAIRVQRQRGDSAAVDVSHQGLDELAEILSVWAKPLRGNSDIHAHVKIVRVTVQSNRVTTSAIVETSGHSEAGSVGQHANWDCQWRLQEDKSLQLQSIHSSDYQEVTASGPAGVWFADCTESVLGKNRSFQEQMKFGLNHWLSRIERVNGIHVFARWGIAVGDVNGDGREDLYVCQPGGLPNRLFVQQPDGTATDVSHAAGVDWLDHTSSALLVDLDNDGDQDLVAATVRGLLVMENGGNGHFQLRATLPPADTDLQSLSAADYDNDGDLDLYICIDFANRGALRDETPVGFIYHDANDGGANVLFRNDIAADGHSWEFADVTAESGLDVNNRRHSLAAAWEDYDNDGDQDLYVANDYGQNCLYRNEGGHFTDVASASDVLDFGSGMSVSWGDYNRDGWMDLYVANMFSSAGNRITRQPRFRPGGDDQLRSVYSRFAKGNSLFKNESGETFREVSQQAAVEMGRWAWSSLFADLNNDGWEDLLVANGYISTEDTGDL
jgi:hypothetical protein